METKNEELGEETAEYTEQLVEAQIKKRMGEITRLRAQYVDGGLTATAADVKYIADVMNALLKGDVQSAGHPVPNALYADVPAGQPFIHYSPDLARQGVSPALQREIRLTSGFIGSLLGMSACSDFYQAVYLGSKSGYTIMVQQRKRRKRSLRCVRSRTVILTTPENGTGINWEKTLPSLFLRMHILTR